MKPLLASLLISGLPIATPAAPGPDHTDLTHTQLADKIQGGLLGQLLGNLNGLPHEMKYIADPGDVRRYTPALPDGARTDDDTDIEWVYLVEMERSGQLFLPPARIVALWQAHINQHVWCANLYARQLFELGLEPPMTGRRALNPWASFNIGGSFLCESFALCAPALPQAAARLALHYTHVGIDGEPAQLTQFVTTMIATAFGEDRLERILAAGLAAVDPASVIRRVAADVQTWVRAHPDDWRQTRRSIRDAYTRYDGHEMRDRNGVELNTAATIAALLYGRGEFAETLRLAFNFGWDADNNAATAGTILGVLRGAQWFRDQGWTIRDVYKNTTRPGMPTDESITRFGQRLVTLAHAVLALQEAQPVQVNGIPAWRIPAQPPANVEPLLDRATAQSDLRRQWRPQIERDLELPTPANARAAYLAICLDDVARLRSQSPAAWDRAIAALQASAVVPQMFTAPKPDGPPLQVKALAAGLKRPGNPGP